MATYIVGQTVKLLNTHDGDGGWSTAYVESIHGSTYGVRVQGHSLYRVTADKLENVYSEPLLTRPTLKEEAERLLSYWEIHGDSPETVANWAIEDLLGILRYIVEEAK